MKYTVVAVLFLSACSTQAIIDTAYPDREKFAFRSNDGDRVLTYTCEPAATAEATKNRAKQAHVYLDARFTKTANGLVNDVFESDGDFDARAFDKVLDKEAEDIVNLTEDRYKCLFTDYRDA